MVKVIILTTEGSNADVEMAFAYTLAGAKAEIVHINQIFNKEKKISDYQILTIPGGFTYGDDVMSGKIMGNQLRYRLAEELTNFVQSDRLILGVCNGFQVLVRTGLLPSGKVGTQQASLIINDNAKFMSQWVGLKIEPSQCIFTQGLDNNQIELPIAHGEGKFVLDQTDALNQLQSNQQITIRYTNNPNGSIDDIAGITDPSGKILGMMPHPERFVQTTQHYNWHSQPFDNPYGLPLFKNAVKYFS